MTILDARKIVRIYGDSDGEGSTTALGGISLSMNKGEFVAIMGQSGSGKTTMLNILSGMDKPNSGEVKINGREISKMVGDELALFRRKQIGFVFQEYNLLDSLTIKENIMLPMILEKKSTIEMEEKVQSLAKLFDIQAILNKNIYNISGGQQQRTAVSRSLVNEPSIIFADEPTGNLDSKSSAVIMECFEKVVHDLSTTVLLVTHDIFSASYCQKVVFIKDGLIHSTIVKAGSREAFLKQIMDNLAVLGGKNHVF